MLTELKPWRKGPWEIMGTHIDSEWRSNLKWDRLLPNLPKMQDKVRIEKGGCCDTKKYDTEIIMCIISRSHIRALTHHY